MIDIMCSSEVDAQGFPRDNIDYTKLTNLLAALSERLEVLEGVIAFHARSGEPTRPIKEFIEEMEEEGACEELDDEDRIKNWIEGVIDKYEAEYQRLIALSYTQGQHARLMNVGDRLSELFVIRLALKKYNWTKHLFHARNLLELTRREMKKDGINIWGDILPKLDTFLEDSK